MKSYYFLSIFMVLSALAGVASAQPATRVAPLSGDQEVPAVDTLARGNALFKPGDDGQLHFKLIVAKVEGVTQAHIHLAPAGSNGPVVAFLFGLAAAGTTLNGIIVEGTLTADDLIGPLAGMPLDELIAEIEAGNAYVNVHTLANPAGEIRGQIMVGNGAAMD